MSNRPTGKFIDSQYNHMNNNTTYNYFGYQFQFTRTIKKKKNIKLINIE